VIGTADEGAVDPTGSNELLSAVIKQLCRAVSIDRERLTTLTGLSGKTMDRYWYGDYDKPAADKKMGQSKSRRIESTLHILDEQFRASGAPAQLMNQMWLAAGLQPPRRLLSHGRVIEQSVGSLLKRYRGSTSREELAQRAFSDRIDVTASTGAVERVEEMQDGDYPSADDVGAIIRAIDAVTPLEAGDIQDLAAAYLWLKDLVAQRARRSLIAVLVASSERSAFWAETVKGCIAFAEPFGEQYWIVPLHHQERIHTEIEQLDALSRRDDIAAVVVCPVRSRPHREHEEDKVLHCIEALRNRDVPVVIVDRLMRGMNHLPHVVPDNEAIGRGAAEAILQHGHRQVGVLLDLANVEPHVSRLKGFQDAIKDSTTSRETIELNIEVGVELPPGSASGHADFRGLLAASVRLLDRSPTAIFCSTSQAALQLLTVMEKRAKRKSGDPRPAISIVSGDDVPLLEAKGIDCMPYQGDHLARLAMEAVIRLIDNPFDSAAQQGQTIAMGNLTYRGSLKRRPPTGRSTS